MAIKQFAVKRGKLYGCKIIVVDHFANFGTNVDPCFEFLVDFTHQCLFGTLAFLDFASGKFPQTTKFCSLFSLCSQDFSISPNHSANDWDCIVRHVFSNPRPDIIIGVSKIQWVIFGLFAPIILVLSYQNDFFQFFIYCGEICIGPR